MGSLYMDIFNLSIQMRNNRFGKAIYDILEDMGIRILVSRWANRNTARKNEKKPNQQMKDSLNFFQHNQEQIGKVKELLDDEESKYVLEQMIKFRCYSRYKDLPHNSMRTQYFVNDFFKYQKKELLVDCGAYDGDSIIRFMKKMKKCGYDKWKVIAFEPDVTNFRNLMRNHPNAIGINAGAWSEDGVLEFLADGTGNSSLQTAYSQSIVDRNALKENQAVVKKIDNVPECKDTTFIKMDIEGAEYNALQGARLIIQKNKPKLAICIYHSDEDMLRIIELLHEMVPEYSFWIRQHSNSICETVLYAQIK